MRILIAHNRYQEAGGEDRVVAEEVGMLARHGHIVELLAVNNDAIHGLQATISAAINSIYSVSAYRNLEELIERFKPDVLHVHNFLPNLSPSIFFAAKRRHVPTVETLHNFRLVCAKGTLFRDNHRCTECMDANSFIPGVVHACYRESRMGSAVVGGGMALHSVLGTWKHRVDRYIALTHFAASQLSRFRVPADRIRVKPNFVPDTRIGEGDGSFALFVGRLSEEKGLSTLLHADRGGLLQMPLHIAGDGPMMPLVQAEAARSGSRLIVHGALSRAGVQELMLHARVLAVPSLWFEMCPMVIIEALAMGLPVACSHIGGLSELVEDGVSGRLFKVGDPEDLATAINSFASESSESRSMRRGARQSFEDRFTEETNYGRLLEIYREMIPASGN